MAVKSRALLKAYKDANRTSNGTNSNTGATENIMWEDVLDSIYTKTDDSIGLTVYDNAQTYAENQATLYDYGAGIAQYICNTAGTTGAWVASKWNRLTPIKGIVALTAAVPYPITFEHDLGNSSVDWIFGAKPFCYDGSGNDVGFVITSKSKSGFTVTALQNSIFEYSSFLINV